MLETVKNSNVYGKSLHSHMPSICQSQRVGGACLVILISWLSLVLHDLFLSSPQLKDITLHYATCWRGVIGMLLGIIEHDNYHKAEHCCNAVLEEWLEVNSCESWNKLPSIIQSPAMSSDQAATEKSLYADSPPLGAIVYTTTKCITDCLCYLFTRSISHL